MKYSHLLLFLMVVPACFLFAAENKQVQDYSTIAPYMLHVPEEIRKHLIVPAYITEKKLSPEEKKKYFPISFKINKMSVLRAMGRIFELRYVYPRDVAIRIHWPQYKYDLYVTGEDGKKYYVDKYKFCYHPEYFRCLRPFSVKDKEYFMFSDKVFIREKNASFFKRKGYENFHCISADRRYEVYKDNNTWYARALLPDSDSFSINSPYVPCQVWPYSGATIIMGEICSPMNKAQMVKIRLFDLDTKADKESFKLGDIYEPFNNMKKRDNGEIEELYKCCNIQYVSDSKTLVFYIAKMMNGGCEKLQLLYTIPTKSMHVIPNVSSFYDFDTYNSMLIEKNCLFNESAVKPELHIRDSYDKMYFLLEDACAWLKMKQKDIGIGANIIRKFNDPAYVPSTVWFNYVCSY
ncbi:MAG TPA: hypothetical protein VEK38_00085, partial [Candidatus Bathyarchaeia archaeon]|nr:hypothetical protein [Candidatus Bathyarchaeia archaeon]